MFDLGNGIWIAPEFVGSIAIHRETNIDQTWEWADVTMGDGRTSFRLDMEDRQPWEGMKRLGLKSLGYDSPEAFCKVLREAIAEAKRR